MNFKKEITSILQYLEKNEHVIHIQAFSSIQIWNQIRSIQWQWVLLKWFQVMLLSHVKFCLDYWIKKLEMTYGGLNIVCIILLAFHLFAFDNYQLMIGRKTDIRKNLRPNCHCSKSEIPNQRLFDYQFPLYL